MPITHYDGPGRNFESNLFASVCKLLHVQKYRTTPYHPSANGQVERYNRTLMNAVRCYINGRQDRWDECLPQIASALRASVNRSTGFTPNRLMLGREVNTPLNLMYPQGATNSPGGTCDDYVTKLEADIQQAHTQARETLKVSQKRMKKDYDIKARRYIYKQGDAVYILDKASIKGRSDKLRSPWKGPGLVKAVLTPYLVEVQLRGRSMVLNHDSLKPCRDGTLPVWLSKARGKLG